MLRDKLIGMIEVSRLKDEKAGELRTLPSGCARSDLASPAAVRPPTKTPANC
jgi:hypothetical protein